MRLLLAAALLTACGTPPAPSPAPAAETPAERDRRELIRQPRRGWAPEAQAPALSIALIAEKSSVRRGEDFRYRIEARNVGAAPLAVREAAPSFIKDGSLCGKGPFRVYAAAPGGPERRLACGAPAAAGEGLDLALGPGEYLLTRAEAAGRPFRRLDSTLRFDALGTYRVRVAFDDGSRRASSPAVSLEVVR